MPRLDWPDLRNARDLGGIATAGGGRIRERSLIRTDNHDRLDAAGVAALRAYGVSRVIDLRWAWEASKYPSPLAADDLYRLVPASFEPADDEDIPTDSYRLLVDASRDQLAAALIAIADAPPGGVVVHCHAGRDRTGVVVALALSLAGVPAESIADDYALSGDCLPSAMADTLAHLESEHGGVEAYLLGSGLTAAQVAAIRDRLTQAGSTMPSV